MAAIVMIFEMTLDYTVIVPITLTVAISYAVRTSLIKDSIYTRKLTLRGEAVPETMRADLQLSRRASDVMRRVGPDWQSVTSGRSRRRKGDIRHGAGHSSLVGRRSEDASE